MSRKMKNQQASETPEVEEVDLQAVVAAELAERVQDSASENKPDGESGDGFIRPSAPDKTIESIEGIGIYEEAEEEPVVMAEAEPAAMSDSDPVPETPETETVPVVDVEPEVYETSDEILREAGSDKPLKQRGGFLEFVKMSGSLFLICAVVALVVSFVNSITEDTIAAAAARERQEAISSIFGHGTAISEIAALEGTDAVYAIASGKQGYCVSIEAKGFGGKIGMMVGVGADGALRGVEIVSHSETPGFGAKADDPGYLGQYIGQGADLTLNKEISAISGATISSKAVLAAVNAATSALVDAGLIPAYHAPEPEPELSEEEQLEAELAALLEELENGGDIE